MDIKITDNDAGQRLDRFLRKAFKATPLSLIHKALRKGKVRHNGKRAKQDVFLSSGDLLHLSDIDFRKTATLSETVQHLTEDLSPLILFEDHRFIAVNKPAGLPVHSGAFHDTGTLIDLIQHYLGVSEPSLTFKPSLAHRLDKGVSGAILAAKTADALRTATELFREGNIRKEYTALVTPSPFADEGTIDKALPDKSGKNLPSKTKWKVVERFENGAMLRVRLLTGRLHQIRRHLAGEGMPIFGDTEYGGVTAPRIMLHSTLLEFMDGQKRVFVEAPLPESMVRFLERMRKQETTLHTTATESHPAADKNG